jgi:hypothetical protein
MPTDYFGFASKDDMPQPNRAQRRAAEKRRRAQQRRGQRAYDRAQRNAS